MQDTNWILCMELGFPTWACDGYKAWTAGFQGQGVWTDCSWTETSWTQHCTAIASEGVSCSATCNPQISYLVQSCPADGLARVAANGGTSCGWDGLGDACELPGAAYCDEECAGTGMGCTRADCDFYANVLATDVSVCKLSGSFIL